MKNLLLMLLSLISIRISAQDLVKGKVRNEKGEPLEKASIYIPNSSRGTLTDNEGNFMLGNLPEGNFTLVISSIGYELLATTITPAQRNRLLQIDLKTKSTGLNEVVVREPDKGGWLKWGKSFMDAFIGTSSFARYCLILNKDKIHFVHDRENALLIAYADEPIQLENRALGYAVTIDLTEFVLQLDNGVTDFQFYTRYTPLEGTEDEIVTWKENREFAYEYSLQYFLTLLAADKFSSKYELHQLIVTENIEKQRVQRAIRNNNDWKKMPRDTVRYYETVLGQPDRETQQSPEPVTFDQIARRSGTSTLVQYRDYLLVRFRRKRTPAEYQLHLSEKMNTGKLKPNQVVQHVSNETPVSELLLLDNAVLEIDQDGYFLSTQLYCNGFWGWWEKLATRLPVEYRP
ncbi:carboxypeptidase-like regulatory domain-containing protein [Flavihumibacter petaseus]|uniref:Carboxypeptidase-like regulatory domain-containing protein n=1 Tax=Flavihumibacter petaseus NBRC 106054 TaxID=1220578 RepID=A0A0E9N4Z6_9BACT|nr:carboxypeptidase-like regulatory domain-containing protein [Flavihumibacter petaseus]GAO44889.1 hypothetical protein FPE01S_04_01320 [Flavihumibacter petaseus NBRC 106054]